MLMHGENFSVLPLTTHINLKNVYKDLNEKIKSSTKFDIKFYKNKKI